MRQRSVVVPTAKEANLSYTPQVNDCLSDINIKIKLTNHEKSSEEMSLSDWAGDIAIGEMISKLNEEVKTPGQEVYLVAKVMRGKEPVSDKSCTFDLTHYKARLSEKVRYDGENKDRHRIQIEHYGVLGSESSLESNLPIYLFRPANGNDFIGYVQKGKITVKLA